MIDGRSGQGVSRGGMPPAVGGGSAPQPGRSAGAKPTVSVPRIAMARAPTRPAQRCSGRQR